MVSIDWPSTITLDQRYQHNNTTSDLAYCTTKIWVHASYLIRYTCRRSTIQSSSVYVLLWVPLIGKSVLVLSSSAYVMSSYEFPGQENLHLVHRSIVYVLFWVAGLGKYALVFRSSVYVLLWVAGLRKSTLLSFNRLVMRVYKKCYELSQCIPKRMTNICLIYMR